jgi:hypothetical protein
MTRKQNKYNARKTVVNGIKFDSAAEARRYGELLLLERAGAIHDLQRQVSFELAPKVKFVGEKRFKPALRYICDFYYIEASIPVLEDCKGVITPVFQVKRHLMKSIYGIDIRIVR